MTRSIQLHPFSVLVGLGIAVLVFFGMGQNPVADKSWEYQVVLDVNEEQATKLSNDGWSYDGYLGTNPRGASTDETLWKRVKD